MVLSDRVSVGMRWNEVGRFGGPFALIGPAQPFIDKKFPSIRDHEHPEAAHTHFTATMIRKQARERRDYLYRRALTLRDAELASKRAALKASLASGKPLNKDIAEDETLRQDYKYDESRADRTVEEELGLDDEYAQLSGVVDPRILVTTSRDPSSRLGTFAKEIRLLLPTAIRLNRGNLVLGNLVSSSKASGLSDLILLHEHRGTPTALYVTSDGSACLSLG
jgi:U3 small nucleolar ribonucleoprotein protein IMP4